MRKKILSLVVALCMMAGLSQATVYADSSSDIWNGSVAQTYAGGDGTSEDPYEIGTADQFAFFAKQMDKGIDTKAYYVLTSDIDLRSQNWTSIAGTYNNLAKGNFFKGNFDGQNHTISYAIKKKDKIGKYEMIGLFGLSEGQIRNLHVAGSITVEGYVEASYIGGLVGLASGMVENCSSKVDITLTDTSRTNATFIGGLFGDTQDGVIKSCLYTGTILSTQKSASGDLFYGGITGSVSGTTISSCINKGNLNISSGKYGSVGGIAGLVHTGGNPVETYVTNCYNDGNISSSNRAGGIAGNVSAVFSSNTAEGAAIAKVDNCFSSGQVTGSVMQKAITAGVSSNNYYPDKGTTSASVENCFYLYGEDDHADKVNSKSELVEKMMSTEGTFMIDDNGDVRLNWEFTKEQIPVASFTATGEDTGLLNDVKVGMKYSIDGGQNWNDIVDTSLNLVGVTTIAGIQIYQPGDNLDTLDSDIQIIDVKQAAAPTVGVVNCSTKEQNDGKLTGVDQTMEYRLSSDKDWTAVTGDTVTGLKNGTYNVRVKANNDTLASPAVEAVIKEHECTVDGWISDENNHWHEGISCGEKSDVTAHEFVWITDKDATDTETGLKHEECSVCGYKKAAVVIPATGIIEPEKPAEPVQPVEPDKGKDDSTETGGNIQIPVIDDKDSSQTGTDVKKDPAKDTTTPSPSDTGSEKQNTSSPDTSDNSNSVLWITLILLAAGLGSLLIYKRKRNQTDSL